MNTRTQGSQNRAHVKNAGTFRRLVRYKIVPEVLKSKPAEGPR